MAHFALCIIQAPTKVWIFAGRVPATLAYVHKSGRVPTSKELEGALQCGPGFVGLKSRTWTTREAAMATAESLGHSVAE